MWILAFFVGVAFGTLIMGLMAGCGQADVEDM